VRPDRMSGPVGQISWKRYFFEAEMDD
jgi:hypothetical protein